MVPPCVWKVEIQPAASNEMCPVFNRIVFFLIVRIYAIMVSIFLQYVLLEIIDVGRFF